MKPRKEIIKMGKKNNDLIPFNTLDGKDPVKIIDRYVGKKGKIGKDKKKNNRFMRGACTHHKLNNKGEKKPAVWKNSDGTATCKICGAKMSTIAYEHNEINDTVNEFNRINNQMKFLSVACNLPNKVQMYFSQTGANMAFYSKLASNVTKVAQRQSENKKKKKKKNHDSSENFGSWRNIR